MDNPVPTIKTKPHLVILVGPTAVGKTEISIELAERLNGEIVSADSRTLYRGLNIGTAKPTQAQQRRVPHHLIDVANPDEIWSLAIFRQAADKAINDIVERGHLPLLVGGTGQYIRAVIQAWDLPQIKPNPRLRKMLEQWADESGSQELHKKLSKLDPVAASQIDHRNTRRTIRALEVIFSSGQRFSALRLQADTPYKILMLGITRPRQELYQRIDDRIEKMFANGLVKETEALLDQSYPSDLPNFSAIGYQETIALIQRKITQEQAIELMRRRTRIYVRRQANWFKETDPEIHWFQISPEVVDQLDKEISNWLLE
jgi:tRNA dimethylallyltransferase